MANYQFTVPFNGHPITITHIAEKEFMVQITYKPIRLKLQQNPSGEQQWIDLESKIETPLTREIGSLIHQHAAPVLQ